MMKKLLFICIFLAVALPGYAPLARAQEPQTQEKIASAMSAAPLAIAREATIMDYSPEGGAPFVELRPGSNGWTCFPDWPLSPGNDPSCYDKTWVQWNDAFNAGADPNITTPGISYMLAGGSDASNIDPFAMGPAPGEDWVNSGPHVMLLMPGKLDTSLFSTDPKSGGSYIMWAGTPYEHLMVPVEAKPLDKIDDKIQSAMSALPTAIATDAAIIDYSTEGGAPFVELRPGTNGWTCLPDWSATPGNDPQCNDKTWMQWTEAIMAGADPQLTAPGVAYMLAGGSDASNTDPFAMEPAPEKDWVTSAAHVMVLVPGKLDLSLYSTDPKSGGPYVMWAGTPYEHFMIPVVNITPAAQPPATLPVSGGAALPWLPTALTLAGLGLLGGGGLLLRRRDSRGHAQPQTSLPG